MSPKAMMTTITCCVAAITATLLTDQLQHVGLVPTAPLVVQSSPVPTEASLFGRGRIMPQIQPLVVEPIVGERVPLPEDGQKWQLTVITQDGYAANSREAKIVAAFDTDPWLRDLKSKSHFHHITPSKSGQAIFDSWAATTALPAVILQEPGDVQADGTRIWTVVYRAQAGRVPDDSRLLRDDIKEMLKELFKKPRPRPWICPPKPEPAPAPAPVPPAPVTPAPDVVPHTPDVAPEPVDNSGTVALLAGLGAFLGVGAIFFVGKVAGG